MQPGRGPCQGPLLAAVGRRCGHVGRGHVDGDVVDGGRVVGLRGWWSQRKVGLAAAEARRGQRDQNRRAAGTQRIVSRGVDAPGVATGAGFDLIGAGCRRG